MGAPGREGQQSGLRRTDPLGCAISHPQRALLWVIAAQFFSTLADNALLFVAISLLVQRQSAAWMVPALRVVFYVSFVVLAVFAGAVADVMPKGRVILATNLVKLGGCFLLLAQVHPLAAYAIVGFGAAAYSPAKYGILPELLPPSKLVGANAVMEVMTVVAILLGVVLGSFLIETGGPLAHTALPPADAAICLLAVLYVAACACSLSIRRMAASNPAAFAHPGQLLRTFRRSCRLLWGDAEGQISLAVTSLFWAASAVLQFVVLRWAQQSLHLSLAQAALLQTAGALGMVAGAAAAARFIPLAHALRTLPLGLAVGLAILAMNSVLQLWIAIGVLLAVGMASGLLLVPLNALLQHRGQALMHPGQSIAVQCFSENVASLLMLAVYGALLVFDVTLRRGILGFGLFVMGAVVLILLKYFTNNRRLPGTLPVMAVDERPAAWHADGRARGGP